MKGKIFKFGKEARESLFKGVSRLNQTVTTTLGPKGRNVAIEKTWAAPHVVHDGVSVAKEVDLTDPFENMGAQMVKEAASKTNDKAGDGTTTSTLLAHAIVKQGMEAIDQGHNPMTLKKGIDRATKEAVDMLDDLAKPVKTKEQIKQIATISSANEEIGLMISDAMEKVGKNGVVTVDVGTTAEMEMEHKEGMEFDKGCVSPHLVTDQDKMESEILDPYILIVDDQLSNAASLVAFLEKAVKETKREDFVIIANDFTEPVLYTIIVNKNKGALKLLAVKSPAFAQRRKDVLEDIAIVTGGKVFDKESGGRLEDIGLEYLGRADRVWADKDRTQIIGGRGNPKEIQKRIEQIKGLIKKEKSDFEIEKLEERLARLTGGVAIVKVGAQTEIEGNEKKERVIDAVAATKSAVDEGVIAGGGVALLYISRKLLSTLDDFENETIKEGFRIVAISLTHQMAKLFLNAGISDEDTEKKIMEIQKLNKKTPNMGYELESEKMVDMFKQGVIDPKKVVRAALQNASSVASMILTTDALVAKEEREVEKFENK